MAKKPKSRPAPAGMPATAPPAGAIPAAFAAEARYRVRVGRLVESHNVRFRPGLAYDVTGVVAEALREHLAAAEAL